MESESGGVPGEAKFCSHQHFGNKFLLGGGREIEKYKTKREVLLDITSRGYISQ
jgi:hypothetical protein